MTTLLIADMDDELMPDLSSLAASNRIAVETPARMLLRRAFPMRNRAVLIEKLDAIAAMTPPDAQSDSMAVLREDRHH